MATVRQLARDGDVGMEITQRAEGGEDDFLAAHCGEA
jgi:hypothetical protein